MAIPLVYKSCLTNEALEAAVADFQEVTAHREEQAKERAEYEEAQRQAKESKEAAGEVYEEEEKVWDEINFAPYQCVDEKFVVCLDSLGQDREFSLDEKRFALQTVQTFISTWEKEERDTLTADRDRKVEALRIDPTEAAEAAQQQNDDMDKQIEEAFVEREDLAGDDELKDLCSKQERLRLTARLFLDNEEWKENLQNIK